MSTNVHDVFQATVHEGDMRLTRSWPSLLATGAVGGIDVSMGILALLLVEALLHNEVVSSLAFSIGFIALALANSELFTENFLVPISAIVAGRARVIALLRLWAGTLATNLLGGWVLTWLIVAALPMVHAPAIASGTRFAREGLSLQSFASALLGGAVITLMTWMQHGSDSVLGKVVAAMVAAFLLAAGHLDHAIVASLEMFAALHAGATFGYLTWLKLLAWYSLGNIIGGIGFVTVLRLVQVGAGAIRDQREQAEQQQTDQPKQEHSEQQGHTD